MNFFEVIFINPALNLFLFFNFVSNSIKLPSSFGFSIVFLTIFIRLILAPLTAAQLKSAAKTVELRPKLAELAKKHGKDKQALAQAQMELYRAHGVNPAAGCLPLILQIPIFIALYQVLLRVLENGANLQAINQAAYFSFLQIWQAPNVDFFGFNLASRPVDFAQAGAQLLLIPPITAILQFFQSKITMKKSQPEKPKEEPDKKPTMEESLAQMQHQMVYLMPIMIGFFSFGFPVGLSLYWNIFTVFGIGQQYLINKSLKK